MLFWFVDNASWFMIVPGFIAVGLLIVWWNRHKKEELIGAGVCVALIFITWLVTIFVVTDREQILNNLQEMADAVGENQPKRILQHLSKDFHFQFKNISKEKSEKQLRSLIEGYQIQEVFLFEVDIKFLSRSKKKAIVLFRFRVTSDRLEAPYFNQAQGIFVLEGERWRLKTLDIPPPPRERYE